MGLLGGERMKKLLDFLGGCLGLVIAIPVAVIIGIILVVCLPFDILRYYQMPYYKNLKKKYKFYITNSDVVQMYNRIVRKQLPMEYADSDGYEYFVKDGQVLLCDWSGSNFEQREGEWYFELEDTTIPVTELLDSEKNLRKPEHRELPAKFLMFYDDITDAERFEQAKECPYFYCVFSWKEAGL